MFSNETNSSLWPCFYLKTRIPLVYWNVECFLSRLGGIMILFLSIICLQFNIRYFLSYKHRRYRNPLVLSLFLASFLVLIISVPTVTFQLFTCHRHCNEILCRIEGFTSYFGGCLCMLIYVILSINRYLLLCQYKSPLFNRYSTIICWIMSLIWTLPPVFDCWISYVPEGLGFHCSINWNDPSRISFYYILSAFLGIYLVPLIILLLVNVRVHQIIRNIYSYRSYYHINEEISNQNIFSFFKQRKYVFNQQSDNLSNINSTYVKKAADRKRLRHEYRFMRAIIFLVSAYIFAWTPYSIMALLQLFHVVDFIFKHALLITLSAFIAKLSVIFAPFIYLYIMNNRIFKKILF